MAQATLGTFRPLNILMSALNALRRCFFVSAFSLDATTMNYPPGMPPPPPGMPMPPPGMMPPPPGFNAQAGVHMPPEMLAQKSQKWIQMQRKRYGEKRKGGYVDMGKQVRGAPLLHERYS